MQSPLPNTGIVRSAAIRATGDYTVVAGDSYWAIAEDHLDTPASGSEVAAYAAELMDVNAPTLGYPDRRLIRPGDVLTAVGTQKIANVEELFAALRQHDPGKVVAISYVRDGETTTAQVQITDRPS